MREREREGDDNNNNNSVVIVKFISSVHSFLFNFN